MARMSDFEEAVEKVLEADYRPNRRERQAKAAFWSQVGDDPFVNVEAYRNGTKANLEAYLRLKLPNWSNDFRDWFFNRQEHKHRVEYLFGLALDAAEEILVNNDPKVQGARVQLIRALSELAGKVPHKQASIQIQNNTIASGLIDTMSKEQLEAYVGGTNLLLDAPTKK
jgi:hypothetical protein